MPAGATPVTFSGQGREEERVLPSSAGTGKAARTSPHLCACMYALPRTKRNTTPFGKKTGENYLLQAVLCGMCARNTHLLSALLPVCSGGVLLLCFQ